MAKASSQALRVRRLQYEIRELRVRRLQYEIRELRVRRLQYEIRELRVRRLQYAYEIRLQYAIDNTVRTSVLYYL